MSTCLRPRASRESAERLPTLPRQFAAKTLHVSQSFPLYCRTCESRSINPNLQIIYDYCELEVPPTDPTPDIRCPQGPILVLSQNGTRRLFVGRCPLPADLGSWAELCALWVGALASAFPAPQNRLQSLGERSAIRYRRPGFTPSSPDPIIPPRAKLPARRCCAQLPPAIATDTRDLPWR